MVEDKVVILLLVLVDAVAADTVRGNVVKALHRLAPDVARTDRRKQRMAITMGNGC